MQKSLTKKPIKLVVSGCCGKMGRRIIILASSDNGYQLVGALEAKDHPEMGRRLSQILMIPQLDIEVEKNAEIIKRADVLIEFTNPSVTIEHLNQVLRCKKAMVIGTTGLDAQQLEKIKEASREIAIVFSPNMSLGVNLIFRLVKEAAQKLTSDYKVDIEEVHHVHKKDAPSGTAKRLVEIIKQGLGREDKKINVNSVRKGKIVGDHQVRFDSLQDTIIIKHSAKTRDIFALGALQAAKFVVQQKPGLYDMQDVIESKRMLNSSDLDEYGWRIARKAK
jgi:4-hydroxy-tetrahydrodipicolinate reductase